MLAGRLDGVENRYARLSHAIRRRQDEGDEWFLVTSANIDELVDMPLPDIASQFRKPCAMGRAKSGRRRTGFAGCAQHGATCGRRGYCRRESRRPTTAPCHGSGIGRRERWPRNRVDASRLGDGGFVQDDEADKFRIWREPKGRRKAGREQPWRNGNGELQQVWRRSKRLCQGDPFCARKRWRGSPGKRLWKSWSVEDAGG